MVRVSSLGSFSPSVTKMTMDFFFSRWTGRVRPKKRLRKPGADSSPGSQPKCWRFFSSIPPDGGDAKEFGAFQTACKAAVGHLTALYQLQRLVAAAVAPKPEAGAASKADEYAEIYDRARARIALLDGPDPLDED